MVLATLDTSHTLGINHFQRHLPASILQRTTPIVYSWSHKTHNACNWNSFLPPRGISSCAFLPSIWTYQRCRKTGPELRTTSLSSKLWYAYLACFFPLLTDGAGTLRDFSKPGLLLIHLHRVAALGGISVGNLLDIPDSIIVNMICWSLVPPVELNDPNVRSTEVVFTSKNTLNMIKPVTRILFTAMDAAEHVRVNVFPQGALNNWPCTTVIDPSIASQLARGDKLESAYQIMNIDRLTDLCMWLLGVKEWSQQECFYPTRSNNGRSLKILVNKIDDRYNTLGDATKSLQPFIMVWTIARRTVSQFKVEAIEYWYASA